MCVIFEIYWNIILYRSPSAGNDVTYADQDPYLSNFISNDVHPNNRPLGSKRRLGARRRRIRPLPESSPANRDDPIMNGDHHDVHRHNDHQHPQSEFSHSISDRPNSNLHDSTEESSSSSSRGTGRPEEDSPDSHGHLRTYHISRISNSVTSPSVFLNETMNEVRRIQPRRRLPPRRPLRNRANTRPSGSVHRTRHHHGNMPRRPVDGQHAHRNSSMLGPHPSRGMPGAHLRRPMGGPFLPNRRGGVRTRGTRRIVSSLSIGTVEEDHAGVYKCVATSKRGTAEQQVQLSVIPRKFLVA